MCPLNLLQHVFNTHTHERAQYNTHGKPGHYPLATDSNILQRNPEASPFLSKHAVIRVSDPACTHLKYD